MTRHRILIIDNDSHFRELAAQMLQQAGYQVQEAGSARIGLRRLREQLFDLVLLELNVANGDGVTLMRRIRQGWPGADLVIITACASLDTAIAALRCRAADYRCKPLAPGQMLACVEQTVAERAERVEHGPRPQAVCRRLELEEIDLIFNSEQGFGLSRREYEVLILILNGTTNREIARQMSVSINTIKTHVRRLYRKMGISSRQEALTLAKKLGLIH